MRTDADDPARVRDPAGELLLNHTATVTEPSVANARQIGTCSQRRSPGL